MAAHRLTRDENVTSKEHQTDCAESLEIHAEKSEKPVRPRRRTDGKNPQCKDDSDGEKGQSDTDLRKNENSIAQGKQTEETDDEHQTDCAESLEIHAEKSEKPVRPRRRTDGKNPQCKDDSDGEKGQSDTDLRKNENSIAQGKQTEETDDGIESSDGIRKQVSMKRWQYEMLKLDMKKAQIVDLNVRYDCQNELLLITGMDPRSAQKKELAVKEMQSNIHHSQIKLEDQMLVDFSMRPIVKRFVDQLLKEKSINCYWETTPENHGVDVFVYSKNRQQEAYDLVKESFCFFKFEVGSQEAVSTTTFSSLWKQSFEDLVRKAGDKIIHQIDTTKMIFVALCTKDLKETVERTIEVVKEESRLVTKEWKFEKAVVALLEMEQFKCFHDFDIEVFADSDCLTVSGTQENLEKARIKILDQKKELRHTEIAIKDMLFRFLCNQSFVRIINSTLERKHLTCFWEVNEKKTVVDLFAFGNEKLQEAHDIMKHSFCEIEIGLSEIDLDDCITKLNALSEENVCSYDPETLIRELKESVKKETDLHCIDMGVIQFFSKHMEFLEEIKRKHAVEIEVDVKRTKFLIRGCKENLSDAKCALKNLIDKKCLKIVVPLNSEAVCKMKDDILLRMESENYKVHIATCERDMQDSSFLITDDCEIIVTNKSQIPDSETKSAIIVAREDFQNVKMETSEENRYVISFPTKITKTWMTAKDKDELDEQLQKLLEIVETNAILSFILPVDDLKGCMETKKFVCFFLWRFQKFISVGGKQLSTVYIQVLDRSVYPTLGGMVDKFLFHGDLEKLHLDSNRSNKKASVIGVHVIEGKLAEQKVDVIVNTVGKKLDLNHGAVSKTLLHVAGDSIQHEIKQLYRDGLDIWQLAVTDGHGLSCKKVFHLVIGEYDQNKMQECLKELGQLIKQCLVETDKLKLKTIAFPVLGTGNLKYRPEAVADVLFSTIEKYKKLYPATTLKLINIVVFPKCGNNIKQAFDTRNKSFQRQLHNTEPDSEEDKEGKYDLVVVGLKDNVVRAQTRLKKMLKEFSKSEKKGVERKAHEALSNDGKQRKREGAAVTSDHINEDQRAHLDAETPHSLQKDISALDKLLTDVKVEVKDIFIKKLPDVSILNLLGLFKVHHVVKANKHWLQGKLADIEQAESYLKMFVRSPKEQQFKTIDITEDVYGLVCSKLEDSRNRILYDPRRNEVTILDRDNEMKDYIEQYKDYQFDELVPESGDKDGKEGMETEKDKGAAESLKLEKIEFCSVEFFFSKNDRALKIAAPDRQILSSYKFALELKTGRKQVRLRHGREALCTNKEYLQAVDGKESVSLKPVASSSPKQFKTKEGMTIYIYRESILKLNVDCIVNAANQSLKHGGGVAKIIAKAAGDVLKKESERYIEEHGELAVGSCCFTSAGNLGYSCIIHTVGPEFRHYRSNEYSKLRQDLRKAVRECFVLAGRLKHKSIGMTSVSSGVYGVPKDWCAEEYASAVYEYSKEYRGITTLKDIHFVDINDEMLLQMNIEFEAVFGGEEECSFQLKPNLTVIIKTGDITEFRTGVVACSQDKRLSSTGTVVKALKKKAEFSFEDSLKSHQKRELKTGDLVVTSPGSLPCAAIFHVVLPDFTTQIGQKVSDGFLEDMKTGYMKCFQAACDRGVAKIAIPLFDCDIPSNYVDQLAETFKNAVLSFNSDMTSSSILREIHVINNNDFVTDIIKGAFHDYIKTVSKLRYAEGSDSKCNNSDQNNTFQEMEAAEGSHLGAGEERRTNSDISVDDKCPICMDKYVNPKKLEKCGHVFCTECIESQFKVTPRCPNCFMVYGVMTGDQPRGSMSDYTDKRLHLKGYEGVGTIVITYNFPLGTQGDEHPQPGAMYKGIYRKAYLPDNNDGRLILKLLKVAFDRRLVFTIGSSRTTGHEGVITWNDIHHKTDTKPYSPFGYPDPTYLDRVKEELAAKGVTSEDITPKETML